MNRKIIAACIFAVLSSTMNVAPPASAAGVTVKTTKGSIFAPKPKARAPKKQKPKVAKVRKLPNRKMYSPKLEIIRTKMITGKPVTDKEIKSLSDAGEGMASFTLAQRLESAADVRNIDSVTHYYALTVKQGRTMAVSSLVSNVRAHGGVLTKATIKESEQALLAAAKSTKKEASIAALALGDFYAAGAPFGKKPDQSLAMLKAAARLGNGDAAFKAGLMLTNGEGVEKDAKAGRDLLQVAAKNGNWAAEALLSQTGTPE